MIISLSHRLRKINPIVVGFVSNLIGNIAMFGLTIFLTRSFSVDVYGQFRLIFAFLAFCVILFQMGRDSGMIYYAQKAKGYDDLREVVREEVLFGFLGLAFATFFLYVFSSQVIGFFLNEEVDLGNYYISIVMVFLWGAFNILVAALKSQGYIIESIVLSNLIQRFIRFPFFLVFTFFSLTYSSLALGMILSQSVLVFIAWRMLGLKYSLYDFKLIARFFSRFSYAIQLGLNSIILVLLSKVDVMVIGKLLGNSYVAIYDVVVLIAFVVTLPFVALVKVGENFMQALRLDKEEQSNYKDNLKISIELSMSVVLFIFLVSEDVLSVFGDDYTVGAESLVILSFGYFFLCCLGAPIEFLNMNGRGGVSSLILVLSIFLNIFLNYLVIPDYGLSGAAFSTIAALLFSKLLGLIFVYKKYPEVSLIQSRPTIMFWIFVVCIFFGKWVSLDGVVLNFIFSSFIVLFYLYLLYFFRYLNRC